ncbi:MAG: hypothetical protein IKZ66_09315 [Schwartzia sp.]|nr:hypothetical protein [Schwartzia sp. (in: firmicutes)]
MSSVRAMTDTDNKMTSLALHGVTAPSQVSQPVGGLVGASEGTGSLTPMLKPVSGLSDFLNDYIDSKNRFESKLRSALKEARQAASSMESMQTAETHRKERAEELKEAATEAIRSTLTKDDSVDKVENFAERYNNLTQFLEENQNVSERAASLASKMNDVSRSLKKAAALGVTSDSNGTIHVNAEKLKVSLKNRPNTLDYLLGKDGLAGSAKKSINLAAFNQNRLFPSVSSAMGREENPEKSMYSPKAVAAQNDFSDRGSMLNLYS